MKLKSHPSKLLFNHLNDTKKRAFDILDRKIFSIPDNFPINKESIKNILYYSTIFHDFGKSTSYFQNKLQGLDNSYLSHHSLLSSIIGYYYYQKKYNNKLEGILVYLLIAHHHSNFLNFDNMILTKLDEDSNLTFYKQIQSIDETEINEIYNKFNIEIDIKNLNKEKLQKICFEIIDFEMDEEYDKMYFYLLLNFLFSILIFSDKEDAIFIKPNNKQTTNNIISPKCIPEYLNNLKLDQKKDINIIRNTIFKTINQSINNYFQKKTHFLLLELPTGAGKTFNNLNIAFQFQNFLNKNYHIIYLLPFTSIIDQTFDIITQVCKDSDITLAKHHYASTLDNSQESSFLTESWNADITVSTFYQIFHTLFTGRNKYLKKFHNIINSIIIIDEIQAIPPQYYKLLKTIFKYLAKYFNTYFIFSTATNPPILSSSDVEIIKKNQYDTKFNRYTLIFDNNIIDLNIFLENAMKKIKNKKYSKILFMLNTIKTSQQIYNELKQKKIFKDYEFIYLSSSILPIDRKNKIEKIKDTKKKQIIVTTQVIEAGVDLDVDVIFRDFAPLDSLIQSAGRVNRNNRMQNSFIFVNSLKENTSSKTFAQMIYNVILLDVTQEILSKKEYDEASLRIVLSTFYKKVTEKISQDISNDLITNIENLEYEEIMSNFHLIKSIPKLDFFVDVNDESKNIWAQYNKIKIEKDFFKKKELFLKIKPVFQNYILSINMSNELKEFSQNSLNYVNSEYYDSEIGFTNKNITFF